MTMCGEVKGKWQTTLSPRTAPCTDDMGWRENKEKNNTATKPLQLKISLFPPDINQERTRTKQKENLESQETLNWVNSWNTWRDFAFSLAKIVGSRLGHLGFHVLVL